MNTVRVLTSGIKPYFINVDSNGEYISAFTATRHDSGKKSEVPAASKKIWARIENAAASVKSQVESGKALSEIEWA